MPASDETAILAEPRQAGGSRAARALRAQGQIPAILYGPGGEPASISLNAAELERHARHPGFMNSPCVLELDKKKIRTLPRAMARDPVRGHLLHIDFFRLSKGAEINVEVPVNFIQQDLSPGLKRGGVLNVIRHEVELTCPVDAIPEALEADLNGLDIGDSIHISHISLPEGVKPVISDRDFTIASVVAPAAQRAAESEAKEEEEGTEAAEAEAKEDEAGKSSEGKE